MACFRSNVLPGSEQSCNRDLGVEEHLESGLGDGETIVYERGNGAVVALS